ncbi:MAG TPA: secretin N-terminal domain-containing protein [Pyrinomonadaceae bacterium]|jgi:general secretion pathway protein D
MKKSAYIRYVLSFLLVLSMLSPLTVLAFGDGKKFFKEGMKAEVAEDWDKAAEQFALAIADNPKNPEYRLHYTRATFNASQMYIRKGNTFAAEKNYDAAYNAYRKAYAYDPTNELAKSEMERMARLYKETNGGSLDNNASKPEVRLVKTGYNRENLPQGIVLPPKIEELGSVGPFPGGVDLQTLIKDLARSLDLNVIFDSESFRTPQKINIELKGVTTAKALDYIFLQQNLFFQKVGPRTILVANTNARQKFQQLVLRTFYLGNANPKDVIDLIGRIIPAQPGRTPTIAIKDDATNSITIRDTAENIQLMEQLIKSLDKDRAEVVMDVAIYEVSKNDLLKLGNQIGTDKELQSLGGTSRGGVGLGGNDLFRTVAGAALPGSFAAAIAIPSSTLQAYQSKGNTKLLASTQIHAFNNEDSSARIGQRVPVRTATISNGFNTGTNTGNNTGFLSDVINYEQVGLTLKFKPIVFPNQDVQVAMEIESKDVNGAQTLTPTFTERTIKGTARVQNNKTLMLASVAQDTQSNGREGLPLLGLIPVLGRLFSVPTKDNRQVDIIIAVTPRVIRAPSILPEDTIERPTGSLAQPTNGSLEAMVIQEEIDEQLANARRLGNNTAVQLPDQKLEDAPTYVRSNSTEISSNAEPKTETTAPSVTQTGGDSVAVNIRPIDSTNVRTVLPTPTADNSTESIVPKPVPLPLQQTSLKSESSENSVNAPKAELRFLPVLPAMKTGEKLKIAVVVKSATAFRSAVLGLKFDDKKLAVRSISYGEVFGFDMSGKEQKPYLNQNGKTYVSLPSSKNTAENTTGVLAFVEVEALADGTHELSFDNGSISITTVDGREFAVKF